MSQLTEERSAGAVLFNRNTDLLIEQKGLPRDLKSGQIVFLLLQYPAGHWDFPKGNIEKGENEIDTARREVSEETNIDDIHIKSGFKKVVEYYYRRGPALIHKKVTYYLAEVTTTKVQISEEHLGYQWLSIDESIAKVSFEKSKKVLLDANKFIVWIESKSENADP